MRSGPIASVPRYRPEGTWAAEKPKIERVLNFKHMATNQPSIDAKLNRLTRLVEKGFAAVAIEFQHRPTISDVRTIIRDETDSKLNPIFDELQSIRRELAGLRALVSNMSGLTKEIDHALARIAAIEKHLGLKNHINA